MPRSRGQSVTLSRIGGPSLRYNGLQRHRSRVTPVAQLASARRRTTSTSRRCARRALPAADRPIRPAGRKADRQRRGTRFGGRVALSSDGNTALVGSPKPKALAQRGCSHVPARPGRSRAGSPAAGVSGATSAGVWPSRPTATRRSSESSEPERQGGTAWVFTRSGATWSQRRRAHVQEDRRFYGSWFGHTLALSATAIPWWSAVREKGTTTTTTRIGAAWVFTRSEEAGPAGQHAHWHGRDRRSCFRDECGAVLRRRHRADRWPQRQRTSGPPGGSPAPAKPGASRAKSSRAARRSEQ